MEAFNTPQRPHARAACSSEGEADACHVKQPLLASAADADGADVNGAEKLQLDEPLPVPACESSSAVQLQALVSLEPTPEQTVGCSVVDAISTSVDDNGVACCRFSPTRHLFLADSDEDSCGSIDYDGMVIYDSDSASSEYDHGPPVRELRTGRYSKLEGTLYGGEERQGLTLFTRFEAAPGASAGYKTLERGMAVDVEGYAYDTWLVRIVGGPVGASAKGKAQWKYVALLTSDCDTFSDTVCQSWHYAPLQKLTPLAPIELGAEPNTKVACNRAGTPKLSFNCSRHEGDRLLANWVPQAINTLSRKAGEATPRVKRPKKA